MKLSKIMHVLSVIVGFSAIGIFLKTIQVGSNELVFGITKTDALLCIVVLMLFAIWGSIGSIQHMMLEKHGEII